MGLKQRFIGLINLYRSSSNLGQRLQLQILAGLGLHHLAYARREREALALAALRLGDAAPGLEDARLVEDEELVPAEVLLGEVVVVGRSVGQLVLRDDLLDSLTRQATRFAPRPLLSGSGRIVRQAAFL